MIRDEDEDAKQQKGGGDLIISIPS